MSENRRQILQLLADGKITPDEAERLLSAVERGGPASPGPEPIRGEVENRGGRQRAKYLRVIVDSQDGRGGPAKVNIRVPMMMVRAGVKLSHLIPANARDEVNAAMARKGVAVDLNQLKPENLEAILDQLEELSVDIDQDRAKVRIFAE
ncbi:MAG: hypothetical protein U1E50_18925 [Caulobacteraceae bacterium]|mgnify:CR=1 FL=1